MARPQQGLSRQRTTGSTGKEARGSRLRELQQLHRATTFSSPLSAVDHKFANLDSLGRDFASEGNKQTARSPASRQQSAHASPYQGKPPVFSPNPRPAHPFGEAAEYYGDQGQSIQTQPGVRPHTPIIEGTQPHLLAPLAQPQPPIEPSSMGLTGAAAEFYGQVPSSSAPTYPNYGHTVPTAPLNSPFAQPAPEQVHAVGPAEQSHQGPPPFAGHHQPQSNHPFGIGAIPLDHDLEDDAPHASSPNFNNHHINQNALPGHPSPSTPLASAPPSHCPHGTALMPPPLVYPGAHHQAPNPNDPRPSLHVNTNFQSSPNSQHHQPPYQPSPHTPLAFMQPPHSPSRRHRTPLRWLVDFLKDKDGVGMYEDYSQAVGICKYCFDEGTTSAMAPRKHDYQRTLMLKRRDREQRMLRNSAGGARIDKNRYHQRNVSSSSYSSLNSKSSNRSGRLHSPKGKEAMAAMAGTGSASLLQHWARNKRRDSFNDASSADGDRHDFAGKRNQHPREDPLSQDEIESDVDGFSNHSSMNSRAESVSTDASRRRRRTSPHSSRSSSPRKSFNSSRSSSRSSQSRRRSKVVRPKKSGWLNFWGAHQSNHSNTPSRHSSASLSSTTSGLAYGEIYIPDQQPETPQARPKENISERLRALRESAMALAASDDEEDDQPRPRSSRASGQRSTAPSSAAGRSRISRPRSMLALKPSSTVAIKNPSPIDKPVQNDHSVKDDDDWEDVSSDDDSVSSANDASSAEEGPSVTRQRSREDYGPLYAHGPAHSGSEMDSDSQSLSSSSGRPGWWWWGSSKNHRRRRSMTHSSPRSSRRESPAGSFRSTQIPTNEHQQERYPRLGEDRPEGLLEQKQPLNVESSGDDASGSILQPMTEVMPVPTADPHHFEALSPHPLKHWAPEGFQLPLKSDIQSGPREAYNPDSQHEPLKGAALSEAGGYGSIEHHSRTQSNDLKQAREAVEDDGPDIEPDFHTPPDEFRSAEDGFQPRKPYEYYEPPVLRRSRQVQFELTEEQERNARRKLEIEEENEQRQRQREVEEAARRREAGINDTDKSIASDASPKGIPSIQVQGNPISNQPAEGPQWTAAGPSQLPLGDNNSSLLNPGRTDFNSLLSSETTLVNPSKKLGDGDPHVPSTNRPTEEMTSLGEGLPHARVDAMTAGTPAVSEEHVSHVESNREDTDESPQPDLQRRTHVDPSSKEVAAAQEIQDRPLEHSPAHTVEPEKGGASIGQAQRIPTRADSEERAQDNDEVVGAISDRDTPASQPDEPTNVENRHPSQDVAHAQTKVETKPHSSVHESSDEQIGQQNRPQIPSGAQKPSSLGKQSLDYQSPYHSDEDRPLSPPGKTTPGAFGNVEFAAALAAGTDLAGFDSNIVTDELAFHSKGPETDAQESDLIEPFPDVEQEILSGFAKEAEVEKQNVRESAGKSDVDEDSGPSAHGEDTRKSKLLEAVVEDDSNQNEEKSHSLDRSQGPAEAGSLEEESHKPELPSNANKEHRTTGLAHDGGEKTLQGDGPEAGEESTSNPLDTRVDDQFTSLPLNQFFTAGSNDHQVHDKPNSSARSHEGHYQLDSDHEKLPEAQLINPADINDPFIPAQVPTGDTAGTADTSLNLGEEQPSSVEEPAETYVQGYESSGSDTKDHASNASIRESEQAAEGSADPEQFALTDQSAQQASTIPRDTVGQETAQLPSSVPSEANDAHQVKDKVSSKGIDDHLQPAVLETGESEDDDGATFHNGPDLEVATSTVFDGQGGSLEDRKPDNETRSHISQNDKELQQPYEPRQGEDARAISDDDDDDDDTVESFFSMTEDSLSEPKNTAGQVSSEVTSEEEQPAWHVPHSRRSSQSAQSDITVRISQSRAHSPLRSQSSLDPELEAARAVEELPFANVNEIISEAGDITSPSSNKVTADEGANCGPSDGEQLERPKGPQASSPPNEQHNGTLSPSEQAHSVDLFPLCEQAGLSHNDGPSDEAEGHFNAAVSQQDRESSPVDTKPASPMGTEANSNEAAFDHSISSGLPVVDKPDAHLQANSDDPNQEESSSPSTPTRGQMTAAQEEAHSNSGSNREQIVQSSKGDIDHATAQDSAQHKDQELGLNLPDLASQAKESLPAEKGTIGSHDPRQEPNEKMLSDAPVLASPVKEPPSTKCGFLSPPDAGSPVERGRKNVAEDTSNATPPRGRRLRAVSVGSQSSNASSASKAASKRISSLQFMKRGHSQSRPSIAISSAKGSGTFYEPPSATSEDSVDWERLNRLAQQSGYRPRAGSTRSRSSTISTVVDKRSSPADVLSKGSSPKNHLQIPSLSVTPDAGHGEFSSGDKVLTDNNPSSQDSPLGIAESTLDSLELHPSQDETPSHNPSGLTAENPEITDFSPIGQKSTVAETSHHNENLMLPFKIPDSRLNAADTPKQDGDYKYGTDDLTHSSEASILKADQRAQPGVQLNLQGGEADYDVAELAASIPLPIDDEEGQGEYVALQLKNDIDHSNNLKKQLSQTSPDYLDLAVNTALPEDDEETVGLPEDSGNNQQDHLMSQSPQASSDYLNTPAKTLLPTETETAHELDSSPIRSNLLGYPNTPDFGPSSALVNPAQSGENAETRPDENEEISESADHNEPIGAVSPNKANLEIDEAETPETPLSMLKSSNSTPIVPMSEASPVGSPELMASDISSLEAQHILDLASHTPLPDDEVSSDPTEDLGIADSSQDAADFLDVAARIPLHEGDEDFDGEAEVSVHELAPSQDLISSKSDDAVVSVPNNTNSLDDAESLCLEKLEQSQGLHALVDDGTDAQLLVAEDSMNSFEAPNVPQGGDSPGATLLDAEARSAGAIEGSGNLSEALDLAVNTPLPNEGDENISQGMTLADPGAPGSSQRYTDSSSIDGSLHNYDSTSSTTEISSQDSSQLLEIAVKVPLPDDNEDHIDSGPTSSPVIRERETSQPRKEHGFIAPDAPLAAGRAFNSDEDGMESIEPSQRPSNLLDLAINTPLPADTDGVGIVVLPSPNSPEQMTAPTSKRVDAVTNAVPHAGGKGDDATASDITAGDDQTSTSNALALNGPSSAGLPSQSVEHTPSTLETETGMDTTLAAAVSVPLPEQTELESTALQHYSASERPQSSESVTESKQAFGPIGESIASSPTPNADDRISISSSQQSETRQGNRSPPRISSAFSALLPKFRLANDGKQMSHFSDDSKADPLKGKDSVRTADNEIPHAPKDESLHAINVKPPGSHNDVSAESSADGARDQHAMQEEAPSREEQNEFFGDTSKDSSKAPPQEAGDSKVEATSSQNSTHSRQSQEEDAVPVTKHADVKSKPGSIIPQLKLDTQFATQEQSTDQRSSTAIDQKEVRTPLTSVTKRRWWVPEKPTFYQHIVNTVKDTLGMTPEEKGEWIEEITTTQQVPEDAPAGNGTSSTLQTSDTPDPEKEAGHREGGKQDTQPASLADNDQAERSQADLNDKQEPLNTSPGRPTTDLSPSVEESSAVSGTGHSILWDIRKLYDERQLIDDDGGNEDQIDTTVTDDTEQNHAQLAEGESDLLSRAEETPLPYQDETEVKLLETEPDFEEDKIKLPVSLKRPEKSDSEEILNLAISTALPDDSDPVTGSEDEQHASKSLSESQVSSDDNERLRKHSDSGMFRPLPKARRAPKFERLLGQLPKLPLSPPPKPQKSTSEQEHMQSDLSSRAKALNDKSPVDGVPSTPVTAKRISPAVNLQSGKEAAQGHEVVARTSLEDVFARQSKADTANKWEIKIPKRPRSDQTFNSKRNHNTSSLQGYGYAAPPSSSVDVSGRKSSRSSPADRLLRRINRSNSLRARQIEGDYEKPHVAGRARAATGPLAYGTKLENAAWPSAARLPIGAGAPVEPNPTDTSARREVIDEGYNSPDAEEESVEQIFEGLGRTVPGSPHSPSRPSSIRQRRSIEKSQVLEGRIEELSNQNKELVARGYEQDKQSQENFTARRQAEKTAHSRGLELQFRDLEIQRLKSQIGYYDTEYEKLKESNEGLTSQVSELTTEVSKLRSERDAIEEQYETEKEQHERLSKDHEQLKADNTQLSNTIEDLNERTNQAMAEKTAEIQQLRDQLAVSKTKVKELQKRITEGLKDDGVIVRDKEHFERRCQELCQHIKSWALRFSKHSDKRVCRTTAEIHDPGIIKRFQSICLDESNIDTFLSDRVRRRDAFMAVVSTMIWENVFNRYLFGMDREQRGKLRTLEKRLSEVGPRRAVQKWRSITISILVRHVAFEKQRKEAIDSTAQDIYHTLSRLLPPPADKQAAIIESLKLLIRLAVDIAIEMRVQRAEYMMLRPFQPRRDEAGQLIDKIYFDASIMNDANPDKIKSNEQLEQDQAVVRLVLFPMVVKKSNDDGDEDDEVVISPAQVLVASEPAKDKKAMRVISSQQNLGSGSKPSVYSSMEDMR